MEQRESINKRSLAEVESIDPNAQLAAELLATSDDTQGQSLQELYEQAQTLRGIDEAEIMTDRPQVNMLFMSELLIGHQDAAVDFFQDTITRVRALPDEMKPDVVVVSGLPQGAFKIWEKSRRATLMPGLTTMDEQFARSREAIDALREIGVPVIYNMSNDDLRIAREYTIEVFRNMQKLAKGAGMDVSTVDRMQRHPQWNTHMQFQVSTVFPYCLHAGRSLHSAEEMRERTGGEVEVEEYFLLFDAERRAASGQELTGEQRKWLDLKALRGEDFLVTDDVNLHLQTVGQDYNVAVRHFLGFSPQPMYQDHMRVPLDTMGQLAANGEAPDMLVTQHNLEAVGVAADASWVVSTGGLIRAMDAFDRRGSRATAQDVSRRQIATRRRVASPTATIHELDDNGIHRVTIFNEALNDKADSLPERMTIAEFCDLQTGSITARPDLFVKYMDYVRTRQLGERAVALFGGGDFMHGRNYPHFPAESQSTGLMAMDSQEAFNRRMFEGIFRNMSRSEMEALQRVVLEIGNHEWNSGTIKWHGYSYVTYLRDFFQYKFALAGFTEAEIAERVKFHDAVRTPKGEIAQAYTGIEYLGDFGVLIQHYLQERGGKGSGGSQPVYQAHSMTTGLGGLMRNIDILMAGHWHHPQWAMNGDKLALVGGSMAGLSGYELMRGYRPTVAGTLIHLGGGQPMQLEFVPEEALHRHEITTGDYAPEALRKAGYKDDRHFDPRKHGILLPDRFAKSALQKALLAHMRAASQRDDTLAELR